MDAQHDQSKPCELVVAGTVHGEPDSEVDLVVAIATVVPDDEVPELIVV